MKKILHTPDGVRDIYGKECEQKLALQQRLHNVIKSYGYRDIETPTFEFSEVFGNDVGTIPSKDLYKFFDRDGETLVLRPDFTPPVARAASKYFQDDNMPLRLTYLGNTFINNSGFRGRLKETTQIGAEFIGDGSEEADAEMIAMAVELLLSSGLEEFQISIGHCSYFDSLVKEAELDEQDAAEIKLLISNRNTFGAEKLLIEKNVDEKLRKCFSALPGLFGTEEIFDKAAALTDNAGALAAVERLCRIWKILKTYKVDKYVSFDLGLLSRYMYYTGILFRGYTYGTGEAVLKGGRYDGLLAHFGKDAPAVGFVTEIDQLLLVLARAQISQKTEEKRCVIIYEDGKRGEAIERAMKLRKEGIIVELERVCSGRSREECRKYAAKAGCDLIEEL